MLKRALLANLAKDALKQGAATAPIVETPSPRTAGQRSAGQDAASISFTQPKSLESPQTDEKQEELTQSNVPSNESSISTPTFSDFMISLKKKEAKIMGANFSESFYSEKEQTAFDPTYLLFRQSFNRNGDVVYGMSRPRSIYIKEALGKEAMALGNGAPTADARNRWIVPATNEDAAAAIPSHIQPYFDFLKNHPNAKYRDLTSRKIESGTERTRKLTLSCKAFIEATVANGHIVHFLLDNGNHSFDFVAIIKKDTNNKAGTIITGKELRHIYKNKERFAGHIQFWKDGKKQKAPWEDNPELWENHFNELKPSKNPKV